MKAEKTPKVYSEPSPRSLSTTSSMIPNSCLILLASKKCKSMTIRKTILSLFPFILLLTSTHAQNGESNKTLFTYGDSKVTKSEFKYIYKKNNSDDPNLYSKKSLEDYLDLYTNFKLKVKAAKEAGLDTTEKFRKEFSKYRDQLADPYLTDEALMDQFIKEAYQRKQTLIKADHITIRIPRGAKPEDTLKAFNTLKKIKQEFKEGRSLKELIKQYQDKINYGKMGYFSVFEQPYPIENIAYNTPEGKMGGPIRSDFGYHLVKVTDKKPNKGKIHTRQVMVKPKKKKQDTANWERANRLINKAYKELESGVSFQQVVAEYSEDRRSKRNNGKLPAFDMLANFFPQKFKEKAFSIKEDGVYTKPFKTRYGYHILKRIKLEKQDSLKQMRQKLKKKIKNDKRYNRVKTSVVSDIKQNTDYKEINEPQAIFNQLDSTLLEGKWSLQEKSALNSPLFRIGDKEVRELAFAQYLEKNQKQNPNFKRIKPLVHHHYDKFKQSEILAYEKANLDKKYPKFRNLIQEYKDGILLFEIMDKKIWSKAVDDTAGLSKYFKENRSEYKRPKTKVAYLIQCPNKSIQNQVNQDLKAGTKPKIIKHNIKENKGVSISVKYDSFPKGQQPVVSKAKDKAGVYSVEGDDAQFVVKIERIKPAGNQPLKAIRGKVVADYQDYLEEQWLTKLRKQYPVKVNEKVLNSLVKK